MRDEPHWHYTIQGYENPVKIRGELRLENAVEITILIADSPVEAMEIAKRQVKCKHYRLAAARQCFCELQMRMQMEQVKAQNRLSRVFAPKVMK